MQEIHKRRLMSPQLLCMHHPRLIYLQPLRLSPLPISQQLLLRELLKCPLCQLMSPQLWRQFLLRIPVLTHSLCSWQTMQGHLKFKHRSLPLSLTLQLKLCKNVKYIGELILNIYYSLLYSQSSTVGMQATKNSANHGGSLWLPV